MVTNILWKDYMAKYYDFAVQRASNCFKRKKSSSAFWDNRIEEENVVRDAAIDALQNVYTKYDPDKGALESYLSRAVHNEVVDKLEKEMKCLSMVKDITLEQEKEYTLDDLASSVSSAVMLNMKERLENAMKELKPVDQVILAYFIDDPSSFVDRAAEELGIPRGRVSVRKTRAIETLSRLLEKSVEDYDESVFFKLPYSSSVTAFMLREDVARPEERYRNPVCPDFDLDKTVRKICDAILSSAYPCSRQTSFGALQG